MKKTIILLSLLLVMLFTISTDGFANDNGDFIYVTIDGKVYKGQISNEPTPYGDPAVDPIPHSDLVNGVTRSARVTASDVRRAQLGDDPEYPYEYVAEGYVTMMDGSDPAYHYSRSEMWWKGSVDTTSGNVWGYGKVDATSWPTPNKGTARIFYGQ